MEVFSFPGLPGIFLSGLFSGSLSTMSSSIASMCAVTWEDILKPSLGHKLSHSRQVTVNQLITIVWGLAGLGVTYMVNNVGGSLLQIAKSFYGIVVGPSLGVFILGALFPWTNWIGALSGAFSSLIILLWIFAGQMVLQNLSEALPLPTSNCFVNDTLNITATSSVPTARFVTAFISTGNPTVTTPVARSFLDDWVYSISFMWYAVIGLGICLTVGLAISFLTGATDPSTVEKRLLFTFMRRYYGKEDEKQAEDKTSHPLMETKHTT